MRKLMLALLALMLGTTVASSQGHPPWHWEKFFKDGMSHDFGTVPRGTQLYHRFKATNIYAVPLEVSARVGCNCVTITPQSRVLQPLQEGDFDVTMDTSRVVGFKSVPIYIQVGPQFVSSTTLHVSANSRTDVVVNPGQINFGVVPRGQASPPQTIDIEYAGVLDWRVSEIVKHSAPLEVSLKELYRRQGQVGYQVAVAIKPDAPPGPFKQDLFLKTNDPTSPLVPILVEANIQASLSVAPPVLRMGNLKVGESVTRLAMVRANKPFHIVAIEGQGDGVVVEVPTAALQAQVLKIRFQPDKPGELRRQLRIKTDLDQESTASVTVEGIVEP